MSQADLQYKNVIEDILENGHWDNDSEVRTVWSDGTPAYSKSTISHKMRFDNSEIAIITSKNVAWKTAIKELLWIWQQKSNVVQDLRDVGVNIWNEWELPDKTIGKAYGYQLAKKNRVIKQPIMNVDGTFVYLDKKVDQVDYLLAQLKTNPSSRRHITTLWNPDDLDGMSLTPCVYETQWYVKDKKLSLEVRARSNDMALGNPFNVFQYNVLQRMIAQVTGLKLGEYIYNIGDAHIYDRHLDSIREQISREAFSAPILKINPKVRNFYQFTIDDFKLENYEHGENIKYEVAI